MVGVGFHAGIGGTGGVESPPILVPYHSRPCFGKASAQLGFRAPGNREDSLYLQQSR